MNYVTLNNGIKMPMQGFGVFKVPDADTCEQAVIEALSCRLSDGNTEKQRHRSYCGSFSNAEWLPFPNPYIKSA